MRAFPEVISGAVVEHRESGGNGSPARMGPPSPLQPGSIPGSPPPWEAAPPSAASVARSWRHRLAAREQEVQRAPAGAAPRSLSLGVRGVGSGGGGSRLLVVAPREGEEEIPRVEGARRVSSS